MGIAAFDAHYLEDGRASAAAVLFSQYSDGEPEETYTHILPTAAPYVPGRFYRRELPCILVLLGQIKKMPDELVIDGHVMLGDRPGLGRYLFEALDSKIPVIGVAKSGFAEYSGARVFRGESRRPLYVTCAGLDLEEASEKIRLMHGDHRIPTLLKLVDSLARDSASH
jgi:deoxyribonuclease V